MIAVTCPECGSAAEIAGEESASEFCTQCDYPLFWALPHEPAPEADSLPGSLRRLPGVAGRQGFGVPCPVCSESNPPEQELCLRCGAGLLPQPPPPPTSLIPTTPTAGREPTV